MGQLEYDNRGYTRLSLELPRDVMDEVEVLRIKWGLRSRGAIIESLLRQLLTEEPCLKQEI